MVAFKYRMPAGIPGAANRIEQCSIEAQIMDQANPVLSYGVPVKIVGGQVRPIASGDAATLIYGLLVRPYPTSSISGSAAGGALGGGIPWPEDVANVLRRGYMTVKLNGATQALKQGAVYVRVGAGTTQTPIGGIEAAADGANTVVMATAFFMGPADADGNVEIQYNI